MTNVYIYDSNFLCSLDLGETFDDWAYLGDEGGRGSSFRGGCGRLWECWLTLDNGGPLPGRGDCKETLNPAYLGIVVGQNSFLGLAGVYGNVGMLMGVSNSRNSENIASNSRSSCKAKLVTGADTTFLRNDGEFLGIPDGGIDGFKLYLESSRFHSFPFWSLPRND